MRTVSGRDPTEYLKLTPKAYGYLKLISAVLHAAIYLKIQIFKRKDHQHHGHVYLADIEAR